MFGSQQSDNTGLPAGDVNPAAHWVQDGAPTSEYVFSAHAMHAAVPDAFLNFPASHAGHGPPFGPVYAGLHEQLLSRSLFADEFVFTGHNVHAAILVVSLYVPTVHTAHGPCFGPV